MINRRFGCFQLSMELIHHRPDIARAVFKDMIVLKAQQNLTNECIEYTGIHHEFELVPVGVDIPDYQVDVIQSEDKLTVSWKPYSRQFRELSPEEQITFREGGFAEPIMEGELVDHPDDPFPKYPLRKVTK